LRRLLYCGEWISSHVLHIYLLHAPDFLGYHDAISLTTNRLLLAGLAFEIAFTAAVVYLPPLQGVFGTAAPPGWVLAMMLPFTVIFLGRRRATAGSGDADERRPIPALSALPGLAPAGQPRPWGCKGPYLRGGGTEMASELDIGRQLIQCRQCFSPWLGEVDGVTPRVPN
jgi:hypothetical protein